MVSSTGVSHTISAAPSAARITSIRAVRCAGTDSSSVLASAVMSIPSAWQAAVALG
ncbi:hypothetical protein ABZ468_36035 [Streptomyces sp. NPDC005708]|uniref:hypothetical protein n=1 Tax=Streptomyces sp. NPDC005708 TaxID=3154564 RepID=UPI0033C5FB1F